MIKKLSTSLMLLPLCMLCGARTLEVAPGSLAERLSSGSPDDKTLVLLGSIDGRDFEALRQLQGISSLDLSGLQIEQYSAGEPVDLNISYFPANTLTGYSLFGLDVEHLSLPASLTEIQEGALAGSAIRELSVPAGVSVIGDNAFYGASELNKISLPPSLSRLGRYAFASCRSLKDINLESTAVTVIPDHCFAATVSLTRINTSRIIKVEREAFAGSAVKSLFLPAARDFAPYALAEMGDLEWVTFNKEAIFPEGLLFNAGSLTEIQGIPDIIPDLFAANCSFYSPAGNLENTIDIGRYAFANSGTEKIMLGRDVTSIEASAFAGCHTLTEIDATQLSAFTPDVDPSAFDGICTSDVTLRVADGCESVWKAHPVWSTFNVVGATTEVSEIPEATISGIEISMRDGALTAISTSAGLHVGVYDPNGRRVAMKSTGSTEISIPLAELPDGLLLVDARSDSGNSARIKIFKQ